MSHPGASSAPTQKSKGIFVCVCLPSPISLDDQQQGPVAASTWMLTWLWPWALHVLTVGLGCTGFLLPLGSECIMWGRALKVGLLQDFSQHQGGQDSGIHEYKVVCLLATVVPHIFPETQHHHNNKMPLSPESFWFQLTTQNSKPWPPTANTKRKGKKQKLSTASCLTV